MVRLGIRRRARTLVDAILPPDGGGQNASFDHEAAQRYEFRHAAISIAEEYPRLLAQYDADKANGGIWHGETNQWFNNERGLWLEFVDHIRSRRCLEIGSGPFGFLSFADWIKDRVVADPLIDAYRDEEIRVCGRSLFTDVRTIASPAEEFVADLEASVDGMIVSRNALDHCTDPLGIIANIARYAAPGCYLLLWTDIWHLAGLDDGHHNITRDRSVMDALLRGFGFEIIGHGADVRDSRDYIEYGALARKA